MKQKALLPILCSALGLTACGDKDQAPAIQSLNSTQTIAVGSPQCFNGGLQTQTGFDSNRNNQLDSHEVDNTRIDCNAGLPLTSVDFTANATSIPIAASALETQAVTFTKGEQTGATLNLQVGYGSAAYRHASDPTNVFYTLTDRGPNIKCSDAKTLLNIEDFCQDKDGNTLTGKIFAQPDYAPRIVKWQLVKNSAGATQAEIVETIEIKTDSGNPAGGLSNPLSFRNGKTNTESATAADAKPLDFDANGLDPEALVKLKDGSFWIAEEYGPSIIKVAADGQIVTRIVPENVVEQLKDADYKVEGLLPAVYQYRKLNRGIESLAVSPDESALYFIMQSPLNRTDYTRSRSVRIMKYALDNGELGAAAGEYLYYLDTPNSFSLGSQGDTRKQQSDVKVSEMLALAEDDLLILERISQTTKLYRVNVASAQNILDTPASHATVSVKEAESEQVIEDTFNPADANAKPVDKALLFNSLQSAPQLASKIEGIARLDENHLLLINDNDFAIKQAATELSVIKVNTDPNQGKTSVKQHPTMQLIGRYKASTQGEGAAEIVQYHNASQSVFAINGDAGNRIEITALKNIENTPLTAPLTQTNLTGRFVDIPRQVTINGSAVSISDVNSLAIYNNTLAVAVAHENDVQQPGVVLLYSLTAQGEFDSQQYLAVRVGVLPDNLVFSPDGNKLVVANEAQAPDDPAMDQKGSISIIDLSAGIARASATELFFDSFNQQAILNINPEALSVAHALEPEYVAINAESSRAFVTLQEANALAIVDLEKNTIVAVKELGLKDHSQAFNALDASDKDQQVNLAHYDHLYGLYQPDTIVSYQVNGVNYLLTANEGDAGDGFMDVDERVEDLTLAAAQFPYAAELQTDEALGRLKVVPYLGQNQQGEHEKLYAFGARSFSIWTEAGEQVFDSGSDFEKITASLYGLNFNNDEDDNDADTRSDAKGPEPEALAVGQIGERVYAFIGLERMGGIMMYDVTEPSGAQFIAYTNNRNFDDISQGDLAPEGMKFVAANDSPTGQALLIVGNEISGTVSVYQVN